MSIIENQMINSENVLNLNSKTDKKQNKSQFLNEILREMYLKCI